MPAMPVLSAYKSTAERISLGCTAATTSEQVNERRTCDDAKIIDVSVNAINSFEAIGDFVAVVIIQRKTIIIEFYN